MSTVSEKSFITSANKHMEHACFDDYASNEVQPANPTDVAFTHVVTCLCLTATHPARK